MSTAQEPAPEWEIVRQCLHPYPDAIEFLEHLYQISQVFDDLYDRDQPVRQSDFYDLMERALVWLPRNQFYQQHFLEFQPLVAQALQAWFRANDAERSQEAARLRVAYVERTVLMPIVLHAIWLCCGTSTARDAAFAMQPHVYEPFDAYVAEHLEEPSHVPEGTEEAEGEPG